MFCCVFLFGSFIRIHGCSFTITCRFLRVRSQHGSMNKNVYIRVYFKMRWLRLGFYGTARFKRVPEKSQFSRNAHLSRFWLGVPDLSRFVDLCSRMLTHRWPKISSDFIWYMKKSLAARGAQDAPHILKSDPRRLATVTLAPYTILAYGARPGLRCPNYDHLSILCCIIISVSIHATSFAKARTLSPVCKSQSTLFDTSL